MEDKKLVGHGLSAFRPWQHFLKKRALDFDDFCAMLDESKKLPSKF